MMMKEKGKMKSEKVRTSLLFTFSLLLFTFAATARADVPTVVFTFDDGFREHYTEVAPILEKYGFRGTFNVITDDIGREKDTEFGHRAYMTWDQVRDLVKRGHAIESHAITHPDLKWLAENGRTNELRRQIFESAKKIEAETGVYPTLLCHPYCQKNLLVDEYTYDAKLVPMGTRRRNFGEGTVANTPTGAGAYIAEQTAKGYRLIDLLTHGVTKEGGAWKPYAKPADFEAHVKEVKALVDAGKVKVALYRDVVKTSRAWPGFEHGIGIGGWLTNYKRFNVLPDKWRMPITAGDLEHFESYITEKDVAYIAKCGFDHIRLGFDQIVMEEKPYAYREQTFKCIDRFLDWCEKYKLNVVLNMHKAVGNYCDSQKDQAGLMDDPELQKRFIALWTEFERRYAKRPNVAFELLNEVVGVEFEKWNALAQKTLDAIRATNKDRTVVIGSVGGNYGCFLKGLKDFQDEKVVYTFHNYEPGFFTHQRGVLNASSLYYNRVLEYPCADVSRFLDYYKLMEEEVPAEWKDVKAFDKAWLKGSFEDARKWSLANPDKVLWFGEFGTIRHAPKTSRVNYMRDSVSIAKDYGFPYCVWNYLSTPNDGNRFSLVDDDTREFLSQELLDACLGKE